MCLWVPEPPSCNRPTTQTTNATLGLGKPCSFLREVSGSPRFELTPMSMWPPVCVRFEMAYQSSPGLLQPLPLPGCPWSHVVLEFITAVWCSDSDPYHAQSVLQGRIPGGTTKTAHCQLYGMGRLTVITHLLIQCQTNVVLSRIAILWLSKLSKSFEFFNIFCLFQSAFVPDSVSILRFVSGPYPTLICLTFPAL